MTSSAPRTACYDWAKTFSLHPRRGRQHPRLTAEPVVIDYETFCKIHDCHDRQGLTIAQTARALGLHPQTVDIDGYDRFVLWRAGLEEQLRGGDLHPALEDHFAKYRKLV